MATWFDSPQMQMPSLAPQQYTPNYGAGTQMGSMIGKYAQYLAPQQSFQSTMPYETYSAPQREVFNTWESQFARPEFQQQQLNPWQKSYANRMATSTAGQMGSAPRQYEAERSQVERPYQEQLAQAQGQWSGLMRNQYEQALKDYYNSPTAFRSIGK